MTLVAAVVLMTACRWTGPNPEVWRKNDLFCWHRNETTKRWEIFGEPHECPEGTKHSYGLPPVE